MSITLQIRGDGLVHDRIEKLISHFADGNKTAFGREIGTSTGVLASITGGRMSNPSFELLQKIITRYPQVNGDWLVMGRGQMLYDGTPVAAPAPAVSELAQLTQEYIQLSKQLEGKKAAYREAASDLVQLREEVKFHESALEVETKHLSSFDQEAQVLMQEIIEQRRAEIKDAQERYAAFLTLRERAEQELLKTLRHQGEIEARIHSLLFSD